MFPLDSYHRRANECLGLATASNDFDERRAWRELAMCWLRLSEHADHFRRSVGRPGQPQPEGARSA
jgi:hypothetical protein